MATTFIGYNTQGQNKKFTLTDQALIKRDFLNGFNIKQGQLPGRPEFGTIIWSYVFEPQTTETAQAVINEVQRVAGYDPRIFVNNVQVFAQLNGLLIQVEISYVNGVDSQLLSIFFDQESRRASFV
jgi:phage baseplate assembly protein W